MAAFSEGANFSTSANGKTLDPRLLDILKTAAQQYGLDVQATSGVQGRSTGTKNHPGGYAVDIKLVDPSTGKALPNYHQDIKGSFPVYEKFAQTARVVQQAKYPELDNQFRWGGYFAGGVNPADLMHFDINPNMHGAMGGGSWDDGASASFKKSWGITTANPGLGTLEGQRQVASIKQGLAGGPLPPMNIPQVGTALDVIDRVVPRPMPAQIASAYAEPQPVRALGQPDAASAATPRLGADNTLSYGQKSGITPEAKYAAAQSSHNDFGLGALTDPRTAALLAPARMPSSIAAAGQATAMPQSVGINGSASLRDQRRTAPPLPPGSGIPGMVSPGNINLNNRPVYFGNDGTYGTERSFSIGTDQGEVLLPQIVGGKLVSEQQAIDHYMKTGENLGIFKTPEAADAYASQLHQRDQGLGNMPVPMPGRPAALGAPSAAPVPMPGRPSALGASVAPAPMPGRPRALGEAPKAQPEQGPVATIGKLLHLPSGEQIAPGIYNQGDHSVQVTDDGNGNAKVTRIRSPMSIPGVIDPLSEVNANTVAGGLIRRAIPQAIADTAQNFTENAPKAIDTVKSSAVDAASKLGDSVRALGGNIGSTFTGMFSGLGAKPVPRNTSGSPDDRNGTVATATMPTVPRLATTSTPSAPSKSSGSSSPQPSAATITGSSTGRTYVVGQKYSNGNGTFVATPTGFKKVA